MVMIGHSQTLPMNSISRMSMSRNGTPSRRNCVGRLAILALLLGLSPSAEAQTDAAQARPLQLPTNPANWINSPPLTTHMLKGKAAVFYLYEEG